MRIAAREFSRLRKWLRRDANWGWLTYLADLKVELHCALDAQLHHLRLNLGDDRERRGAQFAYVDDGESKLWAKLNH